MKITKGKKLAVYFGGVACQETITEKFEEAIPKLRKTIVEGLNKCREVQDVSDLYATTPYFTHFNPITFKMHLPHSLQSHSIKYHIDKAICEDFDCIYDGNVLYVVAYCDLEKEPSGVYDVKDRVVGILRSIVEVKIIPPCLFANPMTFILADDKTPDKVATSCIRLEEPFESKLVLSDFYMKLGYEMGDFYEMCGLSDGISEEVDDIETRVLTLLKNVSNFQKSGWVKGLRNRKCIKEMKTGMVKILEKVCEYHSDRNLLKRKRKDFRLFIKETSLFADIVDSASFEFYCAPYLELDMDSVLKSVDHARTELEAYFFNRYTLISTIAGAIIGSIITIIVSNIL